MAWSFIPYMALRSIDRFFFLVAMISAARNRWNGLAFQRPKSSPWPSKSSHRF